MTREIIKSPVDVKKGANWLAKREPTFARVLPVLSPLPLRRTEDGFAPLLRIIMGQQVSTASATRLWDRLCAANLSQQSQVAAASEQELAACGLSRPKIRYALALARADLDYTSLRGLPDKTVMDQLTAITGIGPWTAQVYCLFSLGRGDVFAPGDLALQEAARILFDLPQRPDAATLADLSQNWSPWRGVAARLLWAYYAHVKNREGALK